MARQRFSYKSLSLAAGLGETTVRDIIIGRARNPRRDTLQKIARTLGVSLTYFLTEGAASIPVMELGSRTDKAASGVREHTGQKASCDTVPVPPESGYPDLAAVRLNDQALMPFLPPGTVLYYSERRKSGFELGALSVAQRKDGVLIAGVVENGALYGRYSLTDYRTVIADDIELEWCARVVFIKPG